MTARMALTTVLLLAAFAGAAAWQTASAFAYSLTISNGYYQDQRGVFAPRHSLTKVDVTNTSPFDQGYGLACENALNNDGTWAQSYSYCADPGGVYVYHPFCGCTLRYGWNGPRKAHELDLGAWMVGVEYY